MPRLIPSTKTLIPHRDNFVGRVRELREFRHHVRYLLGRESPPGEDQIYPHFFLLHGEGGMGKSALLRQFYRIAREEEFPAGRIFSIDLEYKQFPTEESLAQTLAESIKQQFPDFDQNYQRACARRIELAPRHDELRRHEAKWQTLRDSRKLEEFINSLTKRAGLLEVQAAKFGSAYAPPNLALDAEEAAGQLEVLKRLEQASQHSTRPFDVLLEQEFGSDAALFQSAQGQGKALGEDLYELAEAAPLLLMIDTYERADQHDDWFRLNILKAASDRMFAVVVGRNNLKRDYERTFIGEHERLVRAYNLNERALEFEEVRQYLNLVLARADGPPDDVTAELWKISRGVPVAVEALGNQLKEYGDIEPYRGMQFRGLDNRKVVRQVTERFLKYALANAKHDDQKTIERKLRDRQSIRALSLLLRRDGILTSALLGIPPAEVEPALLDLTRRYSFIFAGYGSDDWFASYGQDGRLMHDLVREFVRKDTLLDGHQSFDWAALEAGLKRALPIIHERITQAAQTVVPSGEDGAAVAADIYDDDSWRNSTLDLLNALLWLGREEEAARLLLNRWIEASYYNRGFAEELAGLAEELMPKTQNWRRLLRAVRKEEQRDGFDQFTRFNNLLEPHAQAVLCYFRAGETSVWSVTDADDLKRVNRQIGLYEEGYARDERWPPLHDGLADALYKRASYFYEQGDFEGAFADCDRSLKFRPDDAASLTGRGAARARLGDQRGALEDWNRSIELRPNDWATHANLGDTKLNAGDAEGALAHYERVVELRPEDAELRANRANIRRTLGDLTGAREDFEAALELLGGNIADPERLAVRGTVKHNVGDLTGALADYDRSLQLRPDEHQTVINRGMARHNFGDFVGALADFDHALNLHPGDLIVFNLRGGTRLSLSDFGSALEDYDYVLKAAANDVTALINHAITAHSMGAADIFEQDAARARELSEGLSDEYLTLVIEAVISLHEGDYSGALKCFERALRFRPSDVDARVNCGVMKYKMNDFTGALEEVEQAAEMAPQYFNVISCRGAAKYKLGDFTGALADFDTLLERTADHALTFASRSLVRYRLGDLGGAARDMGSALRLNRTDSGTMYNAACYYALDGKVEEAAGWLSRAIKIDPSLRGSASKDEHFQAIMSAPQFMALL